jgi:hypothetical protein
MGLPTAERLAKALEVSLGVFASALKRTPDNREESRRRVRDACLALLEAQLR